MSTTPGSLWHRRDDQWVEHPVSRVTRKRLYVPAGGGKVWSVDRDRLDGATSVVVDRGKIRLWLEAAD